MHYIARKLTSYNRRCYKFQWTTIKDYCFHVSIYNKCCIQNMRNMLINSIKTSKTSVETRCICFPWYYPLLSNLTRSDIYFKQEKLDNFENGILLFTSIWSIYFQFVTQFEVAYHQALTCCFHCKNISTKFELLCEMVDQLKYIQE